LSLLETSVWLSHEIMASCGQVGPYDRPQSGRNTSGAYKEDGARKMWEITKPAAGLTLMFLVLMAKMGPPGVAPASVWKVHLSSADCHFGPDQGWAGDL
jgi:hypothetical protein